MNLAEWKENGPSAWPGMYPLYAVMNDGELLCFECATTEPEVHEGGEADGWRVDAIEVYWEGSPETCAHCFKSLPSAYGDPDNDQD